MQIAINVASPLLPRFTVGVVSREIILLEFSSTIMCLILSGKVGSNIASEIGTMRVTEQIDALDIMGGNSANYLIMPKVSAFVFYACVGGVEHVSGYVWWIHHLSFHGYSPGVNITAIRNSVFRESFVWTSILKSMIYGFIIASVSAYFGYHVKGGSLEVGKASTDSVVINNILILAADLVFTQLVMG